MPMVYTSVFPNCYRYHYICPDCGQELSMEKFRKHYLKEFTKIACRGCDQAIVLDDVIVKSRETGVESVFANIKNNVTFLICYRQIFVPTFLDHNWEKEGF